MAKFIKTQDNEIINVDTVEKIYIEDGNNNNLYITIKTNEEELLYTTLTGENFEINAENANLVITELSKQLNCINF